MKVITNPSLAHKMQHEVKPVDRQSNRNIHQGGKHDRLCLSNNSLLHVVEQNKTAADAEIADVQKAEELVNQLKDALSQQPKTASKVYQSVPRQILFLSI